MVRFRLVVAAAAPEDGSDVPCAFVVRTDSSLGKGDLLDYLRRRLGAFKLPREIVFVAELPTGPTGKLHRARVSPCIMAAQATSRVGLRQQARPVMEALRDRTDESVLLAVPDPPRVVTLDVVESRTLVELFSDLPLLEDTFRVYQKKSRAGSVVNRLLTGHLLAIDTAEFGDAIGVVG